MVELYNSMYHPHWNVVVIVHLIIPYGWLIDCYCMIGIMYQIPPDSWMIDLNPIHPMNSRTIPMSIIDIWYPTIVHIVLWS